MEVYPPVIHHHGYGYPAFPFFLLPPVSYSLPPNHVHWNQTPDSHLFSADLPGVRKEEIRVEVEDSLYLVIRTELLPSTGSAEEPARTSFKRKFRLPGMVDVDGISAGYEHGVLTVRVPRTVPLSSRTLPATELRAASDGRGNNSVARAA